MARSAARIALALLVIGLGPVASLAQDAARGIRFARHPALSSDGSRLAFSYHGDIWVAPAGGGAADRLTVHEAADQLPNWSPDGKWIAFSSRREGNADVWVMSSAGGVPRRLTFHSADDSVCDWSPDGRAILFASSRETNRTTSLYAVDVRTGATRLVRQDEAALTHATYAPDGKSVAATRGGSWTRKRYRGSGNANLLRVPAAGGAGEWLVKESANERWPCITPDGANLYYVSDQSGTPNVWRRTLPGGGAPVQVTHHTDPNVFFLSMADNGSRLVYECGFGVWTLDLPNGTPRQLTLLAPTDRRTNPDTVETFTSGAQEAVVSPNGRQVALVVHGEVFVHTPGGGDPVRITDTPQREEDVAWSPDGARLAFVSDRDGSARIYTAEVKTREAKALVPPSGQPESAPRYSPDGKQIAFTRGADGIELCVTPAAGGEPRVIVHDPSIGGVAWSPDSRWIAYARVRSHSAGTIGDVFVVDPSGPKPVNVTRYPGVNASPFWSADGKHLYFVSNRATQRHVWRVSLQEDRYTDPADGEEEPGRTRAEGPRTPAAVKVNIDFEEIHRRARQVTGGDASIDDYVVTPDGRGVLYAMRALGRADLWRVSSAGGQATRLTEAPEPAAALQLASDGSRLFYRSGSQLRSLVLTPPGGAPSTLPYSVTMRVDISSELEQMFDEAWRKMRDLFYDEKMHGVDWDGVRARYRPVLKDLATKDEFYTLFSLALGELNASHTGISGAREGGGSATASLGCVYDDTFAGPGARVQAVVPRGPTDRGSTRLQPGDVIVQVDGTAMPHCEGLYRLLADKSGKQVELSLAAVPGDNGAPARAARTVKVRPASIGAVRDLVYEEWVRGRERKVREVSGGKLAYVHLPGMGAGNLESFRRAAFVDAQEAAGLVLDLRNNGGGSIADEMFAILGSRIFGYRSLRGDGHRLPAPMPAFDRPVVVLINENSFSNAEVFPWGFRALKLGLVVGVPTAGGVIGTGGTNLIDGTTLRIPAVGSYTLDGANMENNGCPPDILVEHSPEDTWVQADRQLERAIAALLEQLPAR